MKHIIINTDKKAHRYLQQEDNFKGRTWIVARNYFEPSNNSGKFIHEILNKGNHHYIDLRLFSGVINIKQIIKLAEEHFNYAGPLVIIDLDKESVLNQIKSLLKKIWQYIFFKNKNSSHYYENCFILPLFPEEFCTQDDTLHIIDATLYF
jgi:hypothetical protein